VILPEGIKITESAGKDLIMLGAWKVTPCGFEEVYFLLRHNDSSQV